MLSSADAVGDLADVGSRVLRLDWRDDESSFRLNCHPTLEDIIVSEEMMVVNKMVIKHKITMIDAQDDESTLGLHTRSALLTLCMTSIWKQNTALK